MKNIPEEIDLYDWHDYAFFRAILAKPIPSPKVWDNAGRFGFKGGKFMKNNFFEPDFFESSLYTKEVLDYMIYVGNLDPAKVHKLDGAMHHLFLDMPEEFIELINKILKDD